MHNPKNIKSFNQLQTAMVVSKTQHASVSPLPKNIMALIRHYTLLPPSKFETTIDLIDFLLSSELVSGRTSLRENKINLQAMFKNPELTSAATDSSIEGAMNHMASTIKDHKDRILIQALEYTKEHVILMLLRLPVEFNINEKNNNRWTALMFAAEKGLKKAVGLLIEKGANIDMKNNVGETALMIAAYHGHKETVALLLEKGATINEIENRRWTALMIAAYHEQKETVALLLEKGATINDKDIQGWTALMLAAEKGHKEIAALLLENGANINEKTNDGWTALMIAAEKGHKEIAALLLENGATINDKDIKGWTALMIATHHGHKEIAALLLENGANINEKTNDGWTAYKTAVPYGKKECRTLLEKAHKEQFYTQAMAAPAGTLQELLNEQGMFIERDALCTYLLDLADNEPLVEQKMALLEGALGNHAFGALMKRSDPYVSNGASAAVTKIERAKEYYKPRDYTLLTPTRFETTIDSIDFLLSSEFALDKTNLNNIKIELQAIFKNPKLSSEAAHSSIENTKNQMASTIKDHKDEILFEALQKTKEHVILMLLELPAGFIFNAKNMFEKTALMFAAEKGHKKTVALLLGNGANINDKTNAGWTALMLATHHGHKEIVALLLEKGATINDKDHCGWTALIHAAYYGCKENVALLLEKGSNINDKSLQYGCTALMIAAYHGHKETVALLLERGANVNYKSNLGWTALMIAAQQGHKEIVALLAKAHQKQFYTQAMTTTPDALQRLLNEQPPKANITRDTLCTYLLDLVDKEPLVEQKMALLEGALGNHAFGALMKQSDRFSWNGTSSAVTKIKRAKEYYKPTVYGASRSIVTVQYTVARNSQSNSRSYFRLPL